METYHVWLIMAIILVIVEICTVSFGTICFAFGAGLAALCAYLGLAFHWQLIAFSVASLLTFIFVRPFVIKYLDRKNGDYKTNVDALIGREGVVTERVDNENHTGRVKVDGDDWKAVSKNGVVIEVGKTVKIVERDSLIVTVELAEVSKKYS